MPAGAVGKGDLSSEIVHIIAIFIPFYPFTGHRSFKGRDMADVSKACIREDQLLQSTPESPEIGATAGERVELIEGCFLSMFRWLCCGYQHPRWRTWAAAYL